MLEWSKQLEENGSTKHTKCQVSIDRGCRSNKHCAAIGKTEANARGAMSESRDWTNRLARFGELLMALLMLYSGVMHFKFARFVAGIVPEWIPFRLFWAYFTGVALFAAGISIVLRRHVRLAAVLLALMLSIFVGLIHGPSMIHSVIHSPGDYRVLWSFNGTGGLNNALKDVSLTVGALILAIHQPSKSGNRKRTLGRTLQSIFGAIMLLFGIEHFLYAQYTPGIPSWSFVTFWIPFRLFWGYVAGAALVIGGAMLLAKKRPAKSAIGLGLMLLVVTILTYALRMAAGQGSYSELTNAIKDIAVAGGALILAGLTKTEDPGLPASQPIANEVHYAVSDDL